MILAQYYPLMKKATREREIARYMREYNTRLQAAFVPLSFITSVPIADRRAALMQKEIFMDVSGRPVIVWGDMDEDEIVRRYENFIQ